MYLCFFYRKCNILNDVDSLLRMIEQYVLAIGELLPFLEHIKSVCLIQCIIIK